MSRPWLPAIQESARHPREASTLYSSYDQLARVALDYLEEAHDPETVLVALAALQDIADHLTGQLTPLMARCARAGAVTWDGIGAALKITPEQARDAYGPVEFGES
jgi:hypothetical protein